MLRQLTQVLLGFIISFQALALNSANAIFYPLPTQVKGTFVVAKNLFPGEQGGLWIHDVHGRVLFYDGRSILPKNGSLLQDETVEQVAYQDGAFWTYFDNEVYQTKPNQERQLVFSLSPGAQIRKIGASGRFVWVSDGAQFYTYHLDSREIETYSLLQLYQFSNSSRVYINDAIFIKEKWLLATTSGAYLSENKHFDHISASGRSYVEKVYFSHARRQVLIGLLDGALVFNMDKTGVRQAKIGNSHVLAFAETNQAYWVGTEHGLYTYSFMTGETTRVSSASFQELDLDQSKIYALLNDNMGGMWIATNQGIRYYSLFSQQFKRMIFNHHQRQDTPGRVRQMLTDEQGVLWLADERKLYKKVDHDVRPVLEVTSRINEFALLAGKIWLATEDGLQVYQRSSLKPVVYPYLQAIASGSVEHIVSMGRDKVWLSSGYNLYSVDVDQQHVRNFGGDWIVSKYLPAKIRRLYSSGALLVIGTDHGYYQYDGERIRFNRFSVNYGETLDMITASDGANWYASAYGLYKTRHDSDVPRVLSMKMENARSACLLSDSDGVWLSSSTGLSFYNLAGDLVKHFSSSSGLITNEFLPGTCEMARRGDEHDRIMYFGSKYGLVSAEPANLLVASVPEFRLIISRVAQENRVLQVGSSELQNVELPYGASISFLFGVMPMPDNQNLFYRLSALDEWQLLEGGYLTLEHLNSGSYTLQISNDSQLAKDQIGVEARFLVKKPWYLSKYPLLGFTLAGFTILMLVMYWRSRYMLEANRQLSAQVTLKTNQLRHQSRVLLTSNQQLRKQIQVRNLLVDHVASSIKASVNILKAQLPPSLDPVTQDHLNKTYWQLNELESSSHKNTPETQSYNLSQITQSVVDVWQEDLAKAGLSVEVVDTQKSSRIALKRFNLDVIFNSVLANILKRGYRGQCIKVLIEEAAETVDLSFLDYGQQMPSNPAPARLATGSPSDLNISNLPSLVAESGGKLLIFSSEAQNKIQISWPVAEPVNHHEDTFSSLEEIVEVVHSKPESPEQAWLKKVYQLVENNYHDPDFGTATAAKMLFMSERSLQRRFKSAASRTLKDYLTEVRLETACEELLAGEKISDVAFNCGFNDPSYFSQKFRLHFGLSPSKFASHQESSSVTS
ncbi:AraC family transcriptional regulator [Vibrio sp. CAU 1672]|uniref:AraC family transcriptional regulator n=1 Tax=Vibrio sp. CAU 1672 TaxID=3032594 RepID=UPI0023D9DB0E|nr:AraC family transcriptional regulator [Vibrio sp. CAU 1672]MDF2155273.1 helix-turn-helix domain-containing protein [Vibrio sp. CAU 1672]